MIIIIKTYIKKQVLYAYVTCNPCLGCFSKKKKNLVHICGVPFGLWVAPFFFHTTCP
uniref:Uncharacterized protein n=1 Tax=Helianthus annuus TaxID=4232 RepID=A0A251SZ24_HELAN